MLIIVKGGAQLKIIFHPMVNDMYEHVSLFIVTLANLTQHVVDVVALPSVPDVITL